MKSRIAFILFVLCFVLPTTLALAQDEVAPSPFAGEKTWIAYQTSRTGDEGIWLIHPDGTEDHEVATDVSGWKLLPDWSPDGNRIVFTTRGEDTEPLYEYDLTTEISKQLFVCEEPCLGDDEPTYSPDGTKVAFIRVFTPFVENAEGEEVPSDCGIWIGDVETGEVTQVTSNTEPPCDREYVPDWSPDGSRFTYQRFLPSGNAVFVMDADGAHEERLTDPEMFAGEPHWSPDGQWIVFSTYPLSEYQCCQVSSLYRMHPDGTGMEQLTHYDTDDLRATQPQYSANGKYIVFTAVEALDIRSLWAIPAEGGEPIVIAPGGLYTHGTWQP